jgi:hypothetical protein
MIVRLECIGDETINKEGGSSKCSLKCWHIWTTPKWLGFYQGFLAFSGGEYNESSVFFTSNEDNMASLFNLENMLWRKASLIRHSNSNGKECNLLDLEGVNLVNGRVTTFDPREVILDDILGHDHANFTILYCP